MIAGVPTKDANLRGLSLLPLDTVRLLNSDFLALASGDEFKAALTLWAKSWAQIPAGTLPDDDKILAALSGTGPRWRKLRERALHGWVPDGAGRLQHPVLAEMAKQAYERRERYEAKRKQDADRLHDWRARKWDRNLVETRFKDGTKQEGNPHETEKRKGEGVSKIKSSSSNIARTDVSEGAAEDLARALRSVGFPDCSGNHPDLIAAKQAGVTGGEIAAVALANAGKPLAYVAQAASGKRDDARKRAAAKGEAPSVVIDPTIKAEAEARHRLEDQVLTARSDFDHELIDAETRDQRIADANAAYRKQFPGAGKAPAAAREGARA